MSGAELLLAAEAAPAAATAATAASTATTTALVTEAAIAEATAAAAAEAAAAEAARQAALNAFASSAGEALTAETVGATALEAAPALADQMMYLDPQFAAADPFGMGPNIAFKPELAGENLVSRQVTGQALSPQQAALERFSGSAADAMLADSLAPQAALDRFAQSSGEALADAATRGPLPPTFEEQAYEKFLRQGMDADMPGATWRSIQAGFQNNGLRTIGSLPQYMGMPAPPPGAKEAFQMARVLSPQQQGGTRTSVSPPMLNKGREVTLAAPIAGLLGGAQMPKRRRLSLI